MLSNGNSIPSADNLVPNLNGIRITEFFRRPGNAALRWRGRVGPYPVQRRTSLAPGTRENVGSLTASMVTTVGIPGEIELFRVAQP